MQIVEILAMPFLFHSLDTWLPDNCIKSLPKIVCSNQIKSRSILILQYFDDAAVQNTFIVMDVRIFFQFLFAKYNVEFVLHFFLLSQHNIMEFANSNTYWSDHLNKPKETIEKKSLVYHTKPKLTH